MESILIRKSISQEQKEVFGMLYVLNYLVNKVRSLPVVLEAEDRWLIRILEKLAIKGLLTILKDRYVATDLGIEKLSLYMKRYSDFLNTLDVYHSVDLQAGDFAMKYYYDMDDNQWPVFLQDERWEDLRVAVCEFKGIDPFEIIFMSYVKENRFEGKEHSWQYEITLETAFDEIQKIYDSAIKSPQLAYGEVTAESVIRDIISQGTKILIELFRKEQELFGNREQQETQEIVTITEVYEEDYYEPYYDPFFVPIFWTVWYW